MPKKQKQKQNKTKKTKKWGSINILHRTKKKYPYFIYAWVSLNHIHIFESREDPLIQNG